MDFRLEVPYVTQLNIGGHVAGNTAAWDDPTGCWYASACMIGYFFEQGPRRGVPEMFKQGHHDPLSHDWQDRLLIQREGFHVVPRSDGQRDYTVDEIQRLLEANGPILFYWTKTSGASSYGHASVIVGVTATGIVYHDPEFRNDGGENLQMLIAKFNSTRLYRPGVYGLLQRAHLTDGDLLTLRSKTLGKSVAAVRQKFGG
jgi:hypothetical protein